MASGAIWWIRRDMRLDDNPAAQRAMRAVAMIPLYVHSPSEEGAWPLGGAQKWWLARGLKVFAASLAANGSRLVVLEGEHAKVIVDLARSVGATEVCWTRRLDPAGIAQEHRVEEALDKAGISWSSSLSNHLVDPDDIVTQTGNPYQVYTPFAKNLRARGKPSPPKPSPLKPCPSKSVRLDVFPSVTGAPAGVAIETLGLEPSRNWADGFQAMWTPGEAGAQRRLALFVESGLAHYPSGRDEPAADGSSLLAPHLAFGEIGIRRIWHAAANSKSAPPESIDKFHAELLWREFATHVLFHFKHTDLKPLRAEYAKFPWRDDQAALVAWQRGRTGYPLVDAGMRQLWQTGWMHNRVRMVAASFLVKHLLLPWQDGARWFWDTLVDADLANNSLGWQWAAGCGADAAPYFRIFNPTMQAEKFDGEAAYIKRWVPELAGLPAKQAISPWNAPLLWRDSAPLTLGEAYPPPVVDHVFARQRALAALTSVSRSAAK